ncbi:MAG: translation initiation factor IF-2, partial [Flavobacteriaceae bacterium]
MADQPSIRLNKVLRELNISLDRVVEFLAQKGIDIEARPTTKITEKVYGILLDEFETDKSKKVASHEVSEVKRKEKENLRIIQEKKEQERLEQIAKKEELKSNRISIEKPKTLGKIDLEPKKPVPQKKVEEKIEKPKTTPSPAVIEKEPKKQTPPPTPIKKVVAKEKSQIQKKEVPQPEKTISEPEKGTIKTQYQKLSGPKKTGQTINLEEVNKKEKTVEDARKRKRKRISKDPKPNRGSNSNFKRNNQRKPRQEPVKKEEPTDEEVQKQIRETLEKLQGKSNKSKGAKYRRDKRVQHRQKSEDELAQLEA